MRQKHSSLRWGVTLIAIAVGFGLIEAGGWQEVTPGVIAVLAGATGVGNLAYYFLSRRMPASALRVLAAFNAKLRPLPPSLRYCSSLKVGVSKPSP